MTQRRRGSFGSAQVSITAIAFPLPAPARRLWMTRLLALLVCGAVAATAHAGSPFRPSNGRAARQSAIEAIPRDQIAAEGQAKIDAVLDKVTLFRRLPTQVVACDPELYGFVVTHPEIIANVWTILGIDDVVLTPVGAGRYRAHDAGATAGTVEFLYQSQDTVVAYAEGTYDGPMFQKPVQGSCVLLLRSEFVRENDGRWYVTSRLDAFIRLDHMGAEFLAKTFQPLVSRVADLSFVQTAGFVESLSRAAEANRQGMQRLASRLNEVHPEVRAEFIDVTAHVAQRAAVRQASNVQPLGMPLRSGMTTRGQLR